MTISTYIELQTAVTRWVARDDLGDRVHEFITLAEAKLNRRLRCRQQETRVTLTVDTSGSEPQFLTLPTDFQMMKSLKLSSATTTPRNPALQYMTNTQLADFRTMRANATGQPQFFTVFGTELELAPTPDADYTLEMIYRANIPALSDSNQSNWLLALAPDCYLYGTLLEAAPYMRDTEMQVVWSQGFKSVIDDLNELTQAAKYSAGPLAVTYQGINP